MCWSTKAVETVNDMFTPHASPSEMAAPEQSLNYTSFFNGTEVSDDRLRCLLPSIDCLPSSKYAKNYCKNSGICCFDSIHFCVCDPTGDWTGKRCDEPVFHILPSSASAFGDGGKTAIIVLIVLFVVLVLGVIAFFAYKKRQARIAQTAPANDAESHAEELGKPLARKENSD